MQPAGASGIALTGSIANAVLQTTFVATGASVTLAGNVEITTVGRTTATLNLTLADPSTGAAATSGPPNGSGTTAAGSMAIGCAYAVGGLTAGHQYQATLVVNSSANATATLASLSGVNV